MSIKDVYISVARSYKTPIRNPGFADAVSVTYRFRFGRDSWSCRCHDTRDCIVVEPTIVNNESRHSKLQTSCWIIHAPARHAGPPHTRYHGSYTPLVMLSQTWRDVAAYKSHWIKKRRTNSRMTTADWLGPFYGAIAVPSVTRCRCCRRRCCGHR